MSHKAEKKLPVINFGKLSDNIYQKKQELKLAKATLDKASKTAGKIAAKIKELEEKMIAELTASKIDGVRGKKAACAIIPQEGFAIDNYDKFTGYVHKHKAYDLFAKGLSKTAIIDRLTDANGKRKKTMIPGLLRNTWVTLSVTKIPQKS